MVIFRNIIVAGVVVTVGIILLFWFFQSDEVKIKKRFNAIAELASKVSNEHELTAAISAKKIGEMFSDSIRIEIPVYNISGTYSNENISPRVMGVRSRYLEISLKFHDFDILFPEEGFARVTSTAFVEGVGFSGEPIREVHEIVCWLEKIEKDWFFNQIEVVTILEK